MTIDIAVIDYGMGNLRSVSKAIEHVAPGRTVAVTSDPAAVAAADRSKPFLGICIGLQMLFEHSEEGDTPGLGLLPGSVRRFPAAKMVGAKGEKLKVPHMGWNEVEQAIEHPLWAGISDRSRFYFVHSYYPEPADGALVAGWSAYPFRFACAAARGNLFAVQFHPEKSHIAGLRLLANFVAWHPQAL